MGRLVVLGIDGMDFEVTHGNLHRLPHVESIAGYGGVAPLRSVFPPDSIPAWISAYTGLDPSEHGMLESIDYLDGRRAGASKVDTAVFRGRAFWDAVGAGGRTVCVINPFMAYPVWPVNGVMVNGPVFIDGQIQVSDPGLVDPSAVPQSLGGITDFPRKKGLGEFVAKARRDTLEQAEFGLGVLQRLHPDLFFQAFLTMDRLQHFLWRYCDPGDPTHPGPNPHQDAIRELYRLFDEIVGRYLATLGPDDLLLVVSDHGHGRRCTECFNLNEFFRRKGLFHTVGNGSAFNKRVLIEKAKNAFLRFMNDHDLEDYISVVAKLVPNAKAIKKGKHVTDVSKNVAFASDFTGTNPFGGICINQSLVPDYVPFRDSLISELRGFERAGAPVFQFLRPREEMFGGPYVDRFPDILFEMAPELGVNWAVHTDLFTVNPTHKKISGGHRARGVLMVAGGGRRTILPANCELWRLHDTVLEFFGVENPHGRRLHGFLEQSDACAARQ